MLFAYSLTDQLWEYLSNEPIYDTIWSMQLSFRCMESSAKVTLFSKSRLVIDIESFFNFIPYNGTIVLLDKHINHISFFIFV